jgi:replicative DNA helicase
MEDLKVPPHSIETEQSVLGGLMMDETAWERIEGLVAVEDFYRHDHQSIFAAAESLAAEKQPVDMVTVAERLGGDLDDIGGHAYLAHLVHITPTTANIAHYARTVADNARLRRIITAAGEIGQAAFDGGDPGDLIDTATTKLAALAVGVGTEGFTDRRSSMRRFVENLDELWQLRQQGETPGLPTGLDRFDRRFGGLHRGNLIVVAGRPSMGKSALAHSWQLNQAKAGYKTAIISLEMTEWELDQRWVSQQSKIPVEQFGSANLGDDDWPKVIQATSTVAGLPIYTLEQGTITPSQVRRFARQLQQDQGLDALYVDYLQLMKCEGRHDKRSGEIGEISRALKGLAMELNIPVVLVSQLNRDVEHRTDKRPQMADLRESGDIEQDANVIIFPFRPAAYDDSEDPTEAELIVRKNRQGQTGFLRVRWLGQYTMFADAEFRYEGHAA